MWCLEQGLEVRRISVGHFPWRAMCVDWLNPCGTMTDVIVQLQSDCSETCSQGNRRVRSKAPRETFLQRFEIQHFTEDPARRTESEDPNHHAGTPIFCGTMSFQIIRYLK